ncbi:lycopene cyclase domain-containing protein [Haloplanus pelagicus]|uniref:lycopene cyclase domain-containing protein n=1 Tax=Haloplanus pelagicus TaxID=2949995 RepID=UPI00203EFCAE|nr:lycopene cyclase domain-containing protein [Haloplanus sp. HW8-1]
MIPTVLASVTSTYLAYLTVTVGGPLLVVAALARYRGGLRTPVDALGVGVLMVIAFSYTFAWDGYLIERGVWWYGEGVVTARVSGIPIGELAFFLLQTALTGLWLYVIDPSPDPSRPTAVRSRPVGLLSIVGLELAGLVLFYTSSGYYLGYILLWGMPIVGFLWVLGGPLIWRLRRPVALAILVPTVYLWIVDRVAIGLGLWTISPTHSTGFQVFGLPVEEMAFFLLTNVLVVFGLVLYQWVVARTDRHDLVEGFRGLVPRGGVGKPPGEE